MGHYVELQVGRLPDLPDWSERVRGAGAGAALTFAKDPRIAELMLFDTTSLRVIDGWYDGGPGPYDLVSDRAGALARFRRRMPDICNAFAWMPGARRYFEAFADFFAAIDWPYVKLDTSDYRVVLEDSEQRAFDQDLAFAVAALDRPALARAGRLDGGPGRYTQEWEWLLRFCCQRGPDDFANALYTNRLTYDPTLSGTPYYWPEDNGVGWLLGAYLPRHGALTIPQIERGRQLLALDDGQADLWPAIDGQLRDIAFDCVSRIKPGEDPLALDANALAAMQAEIAIALMPIVTTLNERQKRLAPRLLRAMGMSAAAEQLRNVR